MVVIRLRCSLPAYHSKPSLICDFCPSDQRFAYSFLQIPPHSRHPCCSAIHFPLPGHVQDFHLRERAHGAQTKRPPGKPGGSFYDDRIIIQQRKHPAASEPHRYGLLNGSFIPEKRIREFRDLNRYRKSIIRDITSQKNRIEKFLQSSGFRLSSFISDIFGASGKNIILHLIEHGQIDRTALDSCLKTKTRNHIDEILMSVNGTLSEHQKKFLKILMNHYDSLKEHLNEIEKDLEQDIEPFILQVQQLNSIYGISTTASCAIIAEIGVDMKPFKTAEHICSWAGLCPGNNESAGKRKSTSVTKGNPYIKSMLCEIAWVIAGKRNTYLSAWYWRIKQKKGAKKAIVALARKLLVIIYTMLKQGTLFDESCFEARRKNCEQKQLSRYIRELEKHGYHVEAQG